MISIIILAGLLVTGIAVFILTRPTLPKKYPIFDLFFIAEEHYNKILSDTKTIVDESFSIHASYSPEAFAQLIGNTKDRMQNLIKKLDAFDAYWMQFAKDKGSNQYTTICRAYSESRRKKLSEAEEFLSDAMPFMKFTSSLKSLRKQVQNIFRADAESIGALATILTLSTELADQLSKYVSLNPITQQYQRYIQKFLSSQIDKLESILTQLHSDQAVTDTQFYEFSDEWSDLNDANAVQLAYSEFSIETDIYEISMNELRSRTEYDQ